MINLLPINLLRFILLMTAQVLVFSNINFSPFINPYVYPLFLLLLPFETPRWLLMLLGFSTGLLLDVFLGSLGMHAAACVLLGYMRPYLINVITPKGTDFEVAPNIHLQGLGWFSIYIGIAVLVHHTFYFLIESGTFYNLFLSFLKIFFSSVFSVFFMLIFLLLFTPMKKRRLA